MIKSGNQKKLTLDDVLQQLQSDSGITAVTNAGQVKGGAVVRAAIYDNCHLAAAAAQ